jgi:Uma2 family endonuclease
MKTMSAISPAPGNLGPQELADPKTVLYKLTVERYHEMIAGGLLEEGEPFELLDGNLVHKDRSHEGEDAMTVGHQHAVVVMRLNNLNPPLQKLGCHLRPQQPLSLPPNDEPEPDGAIVRGSVENFADRHPGAKDTLCVIEVADSSLRRDRTTKLRIYAAAGIARYVIVNLIDQTMEVYSDPVRSKGRYGKPAILTRSQQIEFPLLGSRVLTVPVRQILGE